MATKRDKHSTSDPLPPATYQEARGVFVGVKFGASAMTQHVRTVGTSTKEGSIDLRYAPHSPKVEDVKTTS